MAEKEVRKVGQYILAETLGKGGYSWVKKGIDEKTSHPVALKFMTRAEKSWEKEQAEQVRTEIKSLIRINHNHVMKLYAYNLNCKYPEKNGNTLNTILLVLEYCPGGELFDILYYTQQLDEVTARTYFLQMIEGLKACHGSGIVHRDIKPQNLLMDGNYQLKLTDFGLSFLGKDETSADNVTMKTSYVGTRGYQAPELLKREAYKKACDIFSAGVVLFILLTGYPPFEQASKADKWYKPLTDKPPNSAKFWKQHDGCGVDKDCQDLISGMLAYKPKDRLTIDKIVEHKWCKKKTHSNTELVKVLKEKHKETRRRRRQDKKKQSEMNNSIKKRKTRAVGEDTVNKENLKSLHTYLTTNGKAMESYLKGKQTAEEAAEEVAKLLEPEDGKEASSKEVCYKGQWVQPFKKKLTAPPVIELKEHKETLMTFYTKKTNLLRAQDRVILAVDAATDGCATTDQSDPYTITSTIQMGGSGDEEKEEQTMIVQCQIMDIKGTGYCAFKFTRFKGPPLNFHKIWQHIETALLADFDANFNKEGEIFEDSLPEEEAEEAEEQKEDGESNQEKDATKEAEPQPKEDDKVED